MQYTEKPIPGDAWETINKFFETYTPDSVSGTLWTMVVAGIGSNLSDFLEPVERARQLELYKDLCDLVKAAKQIIE